MWKTKTQQKKSLEKLVKTLVEKMGFPITPQIIHNRNCEKLLAGDYKKISP